MSQHGLMAWSEPYGMPTTGALGNGAGPTHQTLGQTARRRAEASSALCSLCMWKAEVLAPPNPLDPGGQPS